MSEEKSFTAAIGELIGSLAALACVYTMRGFLVSVLWSWLVAPVLSLPVINVTQAAGLICAVHGFVPLRNRKETRPALLIVAQNAIYCALLLGIGKVVCMVGAP